MKKRIDKSFGLIRSVAKSKSQSIPRAAGRGLPLITLGASGENKILAEPELRAALFVPKAFPGIVVAKPRRRGKRVVSRPEGKLRAEGAMIAKKLARSRRRTRAGADPKVNPASLVRAGMMAPRRKAPNKS